MERLSSKRVAVDKKVFIIGLDGATFNVIEPLVKEGKLPNLSRITKEGVYAYLDSTIPPLTPVAWPSLFTGKLSGKHGIFDFSHPTRKYNEKTKQTEREYVNSTFIKSKALWELLSEAGKRCIVVDVPLTYPPAEINGLMISREMATKKMKATYPEGLYFKLTRKKLLYNERGKDDFLKEHGDLNEKGNRLTKRKKIQKYLKSVDKKVELVKYLNDSYGWDFFMIVFMESDDVSHLFWKDQRKVKRVYQKLDEAIGKIFSFLPKDCLKLIVSDHGFKSIKGCIFLNEWLFRHGYVKKTFEVGKKTKKLLKNLNKFKEDFHKIPGRKIGKFKFQPIIDYKKSLAYCYPWTSYGIRINLKNREPEGIVEEAEYEDLRDRLIAELKALSNREPIFQEVLKKEQVIGKTDDDYAACDIYLLPKEMDYVIPERDKKNRIFRRIKDGFHKKEGIFFALGDEFKKGFYAGKLSILDITPTILHLMDTEIPCDLDGRVRKEILNSASDSHKRKIRYGRSSQKQALEEHLSQKEKEILKERLRALGYIE